MNQKNSQQWFFDPHLLLALSALFWAGNFIVGRAIHSAIIPVQFNFWRWLIALLLLLLFVYPTLYRQKAIYRKHWKFVLLLAITGIAGFHICVYQALQTTTAINSLLFLSISPVMIMLGSRLLFAEPLSPGQVTGILLSLGGVMIIISHGQPEIILALKFNRGDLWMLLAITLWSTYSVILKHKPATIDQKGLLGITVLVGVLVMLPGYVISLASDVSLTFSPTILQGLAYVSVFASVLAYFCWNYGVARLGPNRAGTFLHLMPLFGVMLSAIVLGEHMQHFHWLGAGLIVLGITLSNRAARRNST